MKDTIYVAVGLVDSFFTGIITAIMKKSKHTESDGLSSKGEWFGLAKKVCTLNHAIGQRRSHRGCRMKNVSEWNITRKYENELPLLLKTFIYGTAERLLLFSSVRNTSVIQSKFRTQITSCKNKTVIYNESQDQNFS